MKVLVTGAAGFIGFHASARFIADGHEVVALDSYDPYYDVALKRQRAGKLAELGVIVHELALEERGLDSFVRSEQPTHVLHLAARPGVRGLDVEPYLQSNLVGFTRLIDAARHVGVSHFVYASSSSVYGMGAAPFSLATPTDEPLSIYAATKKANEALAHAYANLFALPCTGARFFTVYGPWGRPDMAVYKFARAIRDGEPIPLHGGGLDRDFTYVSDVVEALVRLLDMPPDRHRLLNIGSGIAVPVRELIAQLEQALRATATVVDAPVGPGEALLTQADVSELERLTGFRPATSLSSGIQNFVNWFEEFDESSSLNGNRTRG